MDSLNNSQDEIILGIRTQCENEIQNIDAIVMKEQSLVELLKKDKDQLLDYIEKAHCKMGIITQKMEDSEYQLRLSNLANDKLKSKNEGLESQKDLSKELLDQVKLNIQTIR